MRQSIALRSMSFHQGERKPIALSVALDCASNRSVACFHAVSSRESVRVMSHGTSATQSQDELTQTDAVTETDDTEVYHPFAMIPANARAIFVWATTCFLRVVRSLQSDDRRVVRSECEKVISAIDAEVRYSAVHHIAIVIFAPMTKHIFTPEGRT